MEEFLEGMTYWKKLIKSPAKFGEIHGKASGEILGGISGIFP